MKEPNAEQRAMLNDLYLKIKAQGWCFTKENVRVWCGCDERTARMYISWLAWKKPIIAVSSNKGYRIAQDLADIDEARHTVAELTSRQNELEKRRAILLAFVENYGGN